MKLSKHCTWVKKKKKSHAYRTGRQSLLAVLMRKSPSGFDSKLNGKQLESRCGG